MSEKLAIHGGPKAVTLPKIGWPQFDENTIKAVEAVLRSGKVNYWTGHKGQEFEQKFAEWQGSKYAVSVATGTAALHVSLAALGIGPGDEVIVPSYTFIATSFSVLQAGAIPRFADVNLDDHCISVESAEKLVTSRTKAIMPVHLYGQVCEMDKINAFAKKHNLYVIEDNAEAFGGSYKGKKTGTLGTIAGCSFCQSKTFTTGGEGGMITTDDENLYWLAKSFKDHGYDVRERLNLLEMEQKLNYVHNMVGFNFRMTEMQAAMGICELERFDTWNMPRRKKNAHIIMDKVADLKQILYHPIDTKERENGWFVMAFTLDIENMNCNIKEFVDAVVAEGAPVWKVFWPQCHQELAYKNRNGFGKVGFPFNSKEYTDPKSLEFDKVEVPNAKWHEEHTFTCFAYPTYTPENCEQIGDALRKVILHFAK
jgi:dTDP-4-amino-4,6-dideoxygalactose transaminase